MKRILITCTAAALLWVPARAGVIVENEVTLVEKSSATGTEKLYAEGEMARMDPHGARGDGDMSVIFRDQSMWFIDHGKKVCQKIDQQGMAELGKQLEVMMKQFEQMPAEQRAMMEKMMKGKVPGMATPPEMRMEAGGPDQVGEYPCKVHTLYVDGKKTWEVCAADESVGDDVGEAMSAFEALSTFTADLRKIVPQGPLTAMMQSPYNQLTEVGGFPVRVRQFDDSGKMTYQTVLKSITRRDIEASIFEVPAGYKVKDLGKELQKTR